MLQSVKDWVDPNQRVPVVRNEKGYENKYGYDACIPDTMVRFLIIK